MGIVYISPEKMWDTWIFQNHEEYHLFFLSDGNIGRAVSRDLIHWSHLPTIENMAGPGEWDEAGMLMTGSTARVGDRYFLCYGSGAGTPIGLLVSEDLMSWDRYGDKPILPSDTPYLKETHWRDLSTYYDDEEKTWHGYLFGIEEKSGRPAIAHVTSSDYREWVYHEPVFVSENYSRWNDGYIYLEVPDYFQMGDQHYLLFSSVRSRKQATSGRRDAAGTWYLTSESRDGPWEVPQRPLLLGSGCGRFDHYVGRTVLFKGQRLLYHHTWGSGKVSWGTPKIVHRRSDGTLQLRYWSDLDMLKVSTLLNVPFVAVNAEADMKAMKLLGADAGAKAGADAVASADVGDFMLICTADVSRANGASLIWHLQPGSTVTASGFHIDRRAGTFSMVEVRYLEQSVTSFNGNTYSHYLRDDYMPEIADWNELHIRILSRAHQVEIYVDEIWIFSMDMTGLPSTGRFGILSDSGETGITDFVITEIEPIG